MSYEYSHMIEWMSVCNDQLINTDARDDAARAAVS